MYYKQRPYAIRCEWGEEGVRQLAPECDVIVIVDVLSFCTCVDVAVGRGALIYPYNRRDESAAEYARSVSAILASPYRAEPGAYRLSPASLLALPAGSRLVLPSPNGATLSVAAGGGGAAVFGACLRNGAAVAKAARETGERVGVIPAGERWPDGSLRFAAEDWVGAGALIHYLGDKGKSPEARLAESAFLSVEQELSSFLEWCVSGQELIVRGFEEDVRLAGELNCSEAAPRLIGGAYGHGDRNAAKC